MTRTSVMEERNAKEVNLGQFLEKKSGSQPVNQVREITGNVKC